MRIFKRYYTLFFDSIETAESFNENKEVYLPLIDSLIKITKGKSITKTDLRQVTCLL